MKSDICPVPLEQIPIKEFEKLSTSIFFKVPILGKTNFYKNLFYSWIIFLPIVLLILSANFQLILSPIRYYFESFIWSLISPLLIILRHYLSWSYVYNRLRSVNIEYEESGWYDGQIWQKTIEMREKDLLTAQHDIKPIISILRESFIVIISIFMIGLLILEISTLVNI